MIPVKTRTGLASRFFYEPLWPCVHHPGLGDLFIIES